MYTVIHYKYIYSYILPKIRELSTDDIFSYFIYTHNYLVGFSQEISEEEKKEISYFNNTDKLWFAILFKYIEKATLKLNLINKVAKISNQIIDYKNIDTLCEIATQFSYSTMKVNSDILIPNYIMIIDIIKDNKIEYKNNIINEINNIGFLNKLKEASNIYTIKLKTETPLNLRQKEYEKFSNNKEIEIICYIFMSYLLQDKVRDNRYINNKSDLLSLILKELLVDKKNNEDIIKYIF